MVTYISGSLLAATLVLGQTTDVQVIQQPGGRTITYSSSSSSTTTKESQQSQRPILSWFSPKDRPIMSRFQSWFGKKDKEKDNQEPPLQNAPFIQKSGPTSIEPAPPLSPPLTPVTPAAPADFPRKMPSPSSQNTTPNGMTITAVQVDVTPLAPPSQGGARGGDVAKIEQTKLLVPADDAKSPLLPHLANKVGRDPDFAWITGQLELENGAYVIYYATPDTVDKHHGRLALDPQKVDMNQFRPGDLVSVRGDMTQQGLMPVYRAIDVQLLERAKL